MSAREGLIKCFAVYTSQEHIIGIVVDKYLNEHAHELAEKIRIEAGTDSYEYTCGWEYAADLIDPEVGA